MGSYLDHFGLTRAPFSTTPDPTFVFASREHENALLKIAYYTDERQGLFLLMGEVGTGKTTVSQLAVSAWKAQPNKFTVGQVIDASPRTPAAFLRNVLASFGIPPRRNLLDLKAALRMFLVDEYRAGRTVPSPNGHSVIESSLRGKERLRAPAIARSMNTHLAFFGKNVTGCPLSVTSLAPNTLIPKEYARRVSSVIAP